MFEWIADPSAWVALATLTLLEIVLGIDNIIFISILVGKLPPEQRQRGRVLGLGGAMITRILLLLSLAWVMRLTAPLFTIMSEAISGRDLILIIGGLFLIWKSTHEIHSSLEGSTEEHHESQKKVSFLSTLLQIAILDIVFSLDSVITAVGMVDHLAVMMIAVIIAIGLMITGVALIGIVTATLASWIVDRVRDETDKRADEAESETEQLRHNVRELTDTVNQLRDDIARLRRP